MTLFLKNIHGFWVTNPSFWGGGGGMIQTFTILFMLFLLKLCLPKMSISNQIPGGKPRLRPTGELLGTLHFPEH